MLLADIAACVTMHMELPDYNTNDKLYRFIFKPCKFMLNLKRAGHRPAHAIEEVEGSPGLIVDPQDAVDE